MPRCSLCIRELSRSHFSAPERRKGPDKRKCKTCFTLGDGDARARDYAAIEAMSDEDFRKRLQDEEVTLMEIIKNHEEEKEDLYHRAAENIDSWCPDEQIQAFLSDEESIGTLVSATFQAMSNVIIIFADIDPDKVYSSWAVCVGCASLVERLPEKEVIVLGEHFGRPFHDMFHMLIIRLSVMCSLLTRHDSDKLLLCFMEGYSGCSSEQRDASEDTKNAFSLLSKCMVGCTRHVPKAGQLACALLSLILARNPTARCSILDDADWALELVSSVDQQNRTFSSLITQAKDFEGNIHWNYFVTHSIVSLLPALYHLGSWRSLIIIPYLTKKLILLALGLVSCFDVQAAAVDFPGSLKSAKHPSVKYVRSLFVSDRDNDPWRQELLDQKPDAFALVALAEVMGWWFYRGYCRDVSLRTMPDLSQYERYFTILLNELKDAAVDNPKVSYILPIARDMAGGKVPERPKASKSLLYSPFMDSSRRCALPSCRKTKEEAAIDGLLQDNGGDLLRCQGGCEGLEQYCCEAHQREDWPAHKVFCQANKRRPNILGQQATT